MGRTVAARKFDNRPDDWQELLDWAEGFGEVVRVGVEGSGQYGAGVTQWLIGHGLDVREVPAHMTFQERKRKPSLGKSDPADGLRIAAVTLREADHLPAAGKDQLAQDLKAATEHRDQLIRSRTQHANRAHALLSVMRPGELPRGTRLSSKRGIAAALKILRGDHQLRAELVREHLSEIARLTTRITKMEALLSDLLERSGTCLTEQVGIGPVIAAAILAETKGTGRIRTSGGLAMLSGCAPIPASSGTVNRHRLNRGGNRRLNHAIHVVAVNRLRLDEESRTYYKRKIAEGKSKKEALRALKRQVVNRIFKCLEADAASLTAAA